MHMMKLHNQETNVEKIGFYKVDNFVKSYFKQSHQKKLLSKHMLEPGKTVYPGPPSRAS